MNKLKNKKNNKKTITVGHYIKLYNIVVYKWDYVVFYKLPL